MPENRFNDRKKGDKKFALQVKKTYDLVLGELSNRATKGDNKAASELIKKLSEMNVVLYHLGFYLTDSGRMVKFH